MKSIFTKALALATALSTIATPITSVAASAKSETVSTEIGNSGVRVVEDSEVENNDLNNFLTQYEYNGEDYIYGKAIFQGKSYAISRKAFGELVQFCYANGTPEENYVPYTEVEVAKEEVVEEPKPLLPPEKDPRKPWEDWGQEDWDGYTAWVSDWAPDEYQYKLLEYYSATEIYAYYMGKGYVIDEGAFHEFLKAKESGVTTVVEPVKEEVVATAEPELQRVPTNYSKLRLAYELDSQIGREMVFCIDEVNYEKVKTELIAGYPVWYEEAKTTSPGAYKKDLYSFECVSTTNHCFDIEGVKASDAKEIVEKLKKAKVLPSFEEDTDYIFRVRYLSKSGKEVESTYRIHVKDLSSVMPLLNKYTKNDNRNINSEVVADDAVG